MSSNNNHHQAKRRCSSVDIPRGSLTTKHLSLKMRERLLVTAPAGAISPGKEIGATMRQSWEKTTKQRLITTGKGIDLEAESASYRRRRSFHRRSSIDLIRHPPGSFRRRSAVDLIRHPEFTSMNDKSQRRTSLPMDLIRPTSHTIPRQGNSNINPGPKELIKNENSTSDHPSIESMKKTILINWTVVNYFIIEEVIPHTKQHNITLRRQT